jgi:MSHA biogenesis protein MshG
MAGLFSHFGAELPLPTRILMALGEFAQHFGILILIGAGVLVLCLQIFKRGKWGRRVWDYWKLRLPVFGKLIQIHSLKEFASSLQTLHSSGVVLPEGLKISSRVVDNKAIADAIMGAHKEVLEGKALSEALLGKRMFPPLVIRMVAIGEASGNLEGTLGEIVRLYEREIRYMAKSMTTMIEPILTIALGLMVLVFALGVFLPMWQSLRLFLGK